MTLEADKFMFRLVLHHPFAPEDASI